MKRKSIQVLVIFVAFVSCQEKSYDTLRIAVAANASHVIQEIAKNFTISTGIKTELITASSGKLTTQILQGAPFHLFISADMVYPQVIFDNNKAVNAPQIYAYGTLVLWGLDNRASLNVASLTNAEIEHIAIANPNTAPYGKATIEALQYFNVYDKISNKIVTGESISQATQYVLSGAADQGFTALSMLRSSTIKDKSHWKEVDRESYQPITQGAVILKSTVQKQREASLFLNYLYSESAGESLKKFGYLIDLQDE